MDDSVRTKLRGLSKDKLIECCMDIHDKGLSESLLLILNYTAQTYKELSIRSQELERRLERLVEKLCPDLLLLGGCGAICAAKILVAIGDNPERIRSEAALAKLFGVCPLEASSGQVVRHRLNRSGNRMANTALHTIVKARMIHDRETIEYTKRQTELGKSKRDIVRKLTRYLIRTLYQLIVKKNSSSLIRKTKVFQEETYTLQERRLALGLSQKEVAKELKVTVPLIRKFEHGERVTSPSLPLYLSYLTNFEKSCNRT